MDRKNLINRLVESKLANADRIKTFCVCLARRICFAATQQVAPVNTKK